MTEEDEEVSAYNWKVIPEVQVLRPKLNWVLILLSILATVDDDKDVERDQQQRWWQLPGIKPQSRGSLFVADAINGMTMCTTIWCFCKDESSNDEWWEWLRRRWGSRICITTAMYQSSIQCSQSSSKDGYEERSEFVVVPLFLPPPPPYRDSFFGHVQSRKYSEFIELWNGEANVMKEIPSNLNVLTWSDGCKKEGGGGFRFLRWVGGGWWETSICTRF